MLFTTNTASGNGGGVASTGGTLNVYNTTINGNTATANDGGGLYNSGGTVNLVNDTVSANNAGGSGGGLRNASGTFNIVNTIVAGNSATGSGPDVSGTFASGGHNLVGKSDGTNGFTNGTNGDQVGTLSPGLDPQLDALANYGGPTRTRALLPASTAVEAGDNTAANAAGLTTDQRGTGFPRIADSADADTTQTVDIGAFELHPSVEDITDKSTPEDTTLDVTFNIGDGTGSLISSVAGTSSNQTLAPDGNISVTGSGSTRTIHITPAANANTPALGATATITVTVTATNGRTATDTFVLTVTEVNDAPTAVADTVTDINEDSGVYSIPFATLTGNDSAGPANESGQTLTITNVSNPTGGTVQINGTNVEFTPTADFNGAAGFDYTVTDNEGTDTGTDTGRVMWGENILALDLAHRPPTRDP